MFTRHRVFAFRRPFPGEKLDAATGGVSAAAAAGSSPTESAEALVAAAGAFPPFAELVPPSGREPKVGPPAPAYGGANAPLAVPFRSNIAPQHIIDAIGHA